MAQVRRRAYYASGWTTLSGSHITMGGARTKRETYSITSVELDMGWRKFGEFPGPGTAASAILHP